MGFLREHRSTLFVHASTTDARIDPIDKQAPVSCIDQKDTQWEIDKMPTDRAELLSSLEKHNATFTTLLSLIPAQYYIAPTQEEVSMPRSTRKKPLADVSVGRLKMDEEQEAQDRRGNQGAQAEDQGVKGEPCRSRPTCDTS